MRGNPRRIKPLPLPINNVENGVDRRIAFIDGVAGRQENEKETNDDHNGSRLERIEALLIEFLSQQGVSAAAPFVNPTCSQQGTRVCVCVCVCVCV